MKNKIKITESELKEIVKDAVSSILKEQEDPNAIIDEIGAKVEPLYKEIARLCYIYEHYQGGFLGSIVKDLKVASECLEHLMYIVNH